MPVVFSPNRGSPTDLQAFKRGLPLRKASIMFRILAMNKGKSNPIYPSIDFGIPISLSSTRRAGTSVDSSQEAFPNIGHISPLVLACVRPPD